MMARDLSADGMNTKSADAEWWARVHAECDALMVPFASALDEARGRVTVSDLARRAHFAKRTIVRSRKAQKDPRLWRWRLSVASHWRWDPRALPNQRPNRNLDPRMMRHGAEVPQ